MLNVLFVAQRWCGYDESKKISWLSDAYHNFYSSLNTAQLGDCKMFEWDYEHLVDNDVDESLISLCENSRFDVVMFVGYFESFCKFKESTWDYLKKTLNIPIVFCHGDVYDLSEHPVYVFDHYRYADLVVHMDTDKFIGKGLEDNPPKWFFPIPQDAGIFFDANLIRDIPIIFPGSLGQYQTRDELLAYIQNVGLPIKHVGGRRPETYLAPAQYALKHMRAQFSISVNHDDDHLVGHTAESMLCGCCTFVNKNRITQKLFNAGVDYVEYENLSELADKIIYYMDNLDEAAVIANNGKHAVQQYSAYNFYDNIFMILTKIHSNFKYKGFTTVDRIVDGFNIRVLQDK